MPENSNAKTSAQVTIHIGYQERLDLMNRNRGELSPEEPLRVKRHCQLKEHRDSTNIWEHNHLPSDALSLQPYGS